MKPLLITIILSVFVHASALYYYDNGEKIAVTKLDEYSQYDYYKNSKNQTLGINNTIIVKFLIDVDIDDIESKYNVSLDKKLAHNVYLFDVNGNNVFTTSSKIFEEENVEFSNPNFVKQRRRR